MVRTVPGSQIPLDGPAKAGVEVSACLESKSFFGAADVEPAPRLAIRLFGVPHDPAVESGQNRDGLGQIGDADFLAASEITCK